MAMSQDFVSSFLEFPPHTKLSAKEYDKRAHTFVAGLSKQNISQWSKTVDKANLLDVLNPAVNSIPFLFALNALARGAGKDKAKHEDALSSAAVFFATFDPIQIRYAGECFFALFEAILETYNKLDITDCSPLTTALLRLDPTGATFTSLHIRVLRQCLHAGAPSQALPLLDKNITAYPTLLPKALPDELLCEDHAHSNAFITIKSGFTLHPIKSEWILEYYLLGAHIYLGQRNFPRARLFLEYILLYPTVGTNPSALQAEAFKKWLLLGLLAQGKPYPIPRTHSQQILKSLKQACRPYEVLAENFEKRAWRKFQAEVDAGANLWQEDGNTRLVRETNEWLIRWRVLDLQNTYSTLPVSRVAALLDFQPDMALALLTNMVEQGHLDAHITPPAPGSPSPVLHFHTSLAQATATIPADSLEAQAARITTLISAIRDADRRLQLTKEYVEVQKRNKRGGADPDGDLADQMDLSYDQPLGGSYDDNEGGPMGEAEEDIMER